MFFNARVEYDGVVDNLAVSLYNSVVRILGVRFLTGLFFLFWLVPTVCNGKQENASK